MAEDTMKALADLPALLAGLADGPDLSGYDTRLILPAEPAPIDLIEATRAALQRPAGSVRLSELAAGRRSAVIVTSDATRAVPNRALLPLVIDELRSAGIGEADVTVLIALGAHRQLARSELAELLGAELLDRVRVVNHAPSGGCVSVGSTSSGNELCVASAFVEADVRIALGLVEPHEFAGFTGGGKAILPGIAAKDSIVRNHSLEMLRRPGARPGELEANPIRREMDEAARLSGLQFIVNVVLDRRLRPLAVAAGDPLQAHAELARFVRAYASVSAPGDVECPHEPPDLVVTGPGEPLDVNLYQSIKPLVAVEPWVDAASSVVLLARCREGDGSSEMIEPFLDGGTPEEILDRLPAQYTIEKDHSFFIARFLSRCPHVTACCPGVSPEKLETLGFSSASTVGAALSRAGVRHARSTRRARPLAVLFPSPQRFLLGPWG
jgi:nickel-dependent lactate racemase